MFWQMLIFGIVILAILLVSVFNKYFLWNNLYKKGGKDVYKKVSQKERLGVRDKIWL